MLTDGSKGIPDAPVVPRSLTALDWLNTFVDEMLMAGDRTGRPSPPETVAVPFAQTLPAVFPVLQGEGRAFDGDMLDRVVLGYAPMVDRRGAVMATRLTVVPMDPRSAIDSTALLRTIGRVWPEHGGAVSLNVASDTLLEGLLRAVPARNVMMEVPASIAADARNSDALLELTRRGNMLLLKGRPARELPRDVLQCFLWSIIDVDEDRRAGASAPPQGVHRQIEFVQSGVKTMAQFKESIGRGAVAVLGWPLNEPAVGGGARFDLQVIVEMINRIDCRESIEAVEKTMVRDPVLAFELMRHAQERNLGLPVETGSFGHAIMMLGYQELRRWLAFMLGASGDESFLQPVNYGALRRGLFMRELAADADDEETRGELFMCGVFSLLDRLLGKPLDQLLASLVVPDRTRQALSEGRGPFMPMLGMARAVESDSPDEIRAAAQALYLKPAEANRALMRALALGRQLGGA
jgi:EAL and modified HD-GYP domain-containing signal transduction protein